MRRRVDVPTILAFLLLLAVGAAGLRGALAQVGQPFPGFLVLENRVVASISLSSWSEASSGALFQHQVVAIDDEPIADVREIGAIAGAHPIGTPLAVQLAGENGVITRHVATRWFGWGDFALLHGLFLLNGLALGFATLVAVAHRRRAAARACLPLLATGAIWVLSAMDLYGPSTLFRLHALAEALLFPAALVMALRFPTPAGLLDRHPWLPVAVYGFAAGCAIPYQWMLADLHGYVTTHLFAISAFGLALVVLLLAQFARLRGPMSASARERLLVAAMGSLLALAVPIGFMAAEWLTGGRSPQNALALTGVIFPLALSHALARPVVAETVPASL